MASIANSTPDAVMEGHSTATDYDMSTVKRRQGQADGPNGTASHRYDSEDRKKEQLKKVSFPQEVLTICLFEACASALLKNDVG
jgi:hypothetical protein